MQSPFLDAVKTSWLGVTMRGTPDLFPAMEMAHFVGLSLLMGVMIVVDLKILGGFRRTAYAAVFKLLPFAMLGFAINLMSGIAFIATNPYLYFTNKAFYVKLTLILLGGLNALWFTFAEQRQIAGLPAEADAPAAAKAMAAASLAMWVLVIVAGRLLPDLRGRRGRMSGLPGRDRDGGYGWISITLHWLTAGAIFALLYVGDSISVGGDGTLRTHTTIAACAWVLLAARIAWRVVEGHPPPLGRPGWTSRLGEATHWVLLGAVGLMLVSGPVAALSHDAGLRVFDLTLHGPWPSRPALATAATAHRIGALTLVWGVVLHVAGVGWHLVVKRDGLFDRIMVPLPRPPG